MTIDRRATTGFDAFKKRSKMINQGMIKNFLGLYQKQEGLSFEQLKRSVLLMDSGFIKFMENLDEEILLVSDAMEEEEYSRLERAMPGKFPKERLLQRVNNCFLQLNLDQSVKEVEKNCRVVRAAVDELLRCQKTITTIIIDIYQFVIKYKEKTSAPF